MRALFRYLWLAAAFVAAMHGDDITIPMDGGGSIVIKNPTFMRIDEFNIHQPELRFSISDNSSTPWKHLDLQFDIGGFCRGQVSQWSDIVGVSPDPEVRTHIVKHLISGFPLQGCETEIIKARIWTPPEHTGPSSSLTAEEIIAHKVKREADEAEQKRLANEERVKEAQEQAKKDAAEAVRRKRLAAEQKKKDAELDARLAKDREEEQARAADERRKIRAACAVIYRNTVDKKIRDLTVGEEQQVRACQALGLYPPQ